MVVVKFGGSSVANIERIRRAAAIVSDRYASSNCPEEKDVVVVVSAMSGVTDHLNSYLVELAASDTQESDVVLAAGEQVSTALFAIALNKIGHRAKSFLGWQVPIVSDSTPCNARITEILANNIKDCLRNGVIPVIAGFQGITNTSRITTLGRGGSDTTAVALAGALSAARCDIYTDVNGFFTSDPRKVTLARKIDSLSFEEACEMAFCGAKVLQHRSVEIAMRYNAKVRVLPTFGSSTGTELR
jgi:aspartate kinase